MTLAAEIGPHAEQEEVAQKLAASHQLGAGPPAKLDAYRSLSALPDWLDKVRRYCQNPEPDHSRAADWLLDNDYQVARALRRLQEDLPVSFYKRLPALDTAPDENVPRIYAVSQALLDALQPQVSLHGLVGFINAYQKVSELTYAELWAFPSMLRLSSLERLIDALTELNPALRPSLETSVYSKSPRGGDATDRIARAISDLVAVHTIKWADFVDQTSCIEAILGEDPAGAYRLMTLETRNRYRKSVERLAFRSGFSEPDVARAAITLSRADSDKPRQGHVGYWLIDQGQRQLETTIGYRTPTGASFRRHMMRNARKIYATALIAGVFAALVVPYAYLWYQDATLWQWLGGSALSLLPATVLSVTVVHWVITRLTRPTALPELDFTKTIPKDFTTAVVIPVIVAHADEAVHIAEKLEIRRLSNPDPNLRFVVLSDLADANTQSLPGDHGIEQALTDTIRNLNTRYEDGQGGPFVLLHRARSFNPCENCWMGWERKRGKLEEFNRMVLGETTGGFSLTEGRVERLSGVRFAIALDADTDLPPASAARLVGTLAHPLNRAEFDSGSDRLEVGYSILQPRIEILPDTGTGTQFSHLYAGDTAIDIYSRAVSDVYQDLFATGIFVGKGIYDIAAVQKTMAGRVPENRILSHDLFEGVHGRTALASNIVLYEDFPETYPEFAMRLHRWIRGDWQLTPWLGRTVPTAEGGAIPNALSALDRWKIADNLRRSLVPPALLLFFIGGWMILPGSAIVWTLLALAAPGSFLVGELYAVLTGGIRRGFLGNAAHRFAERGGRWFFAIAFLVSDTLVALDAVFRTLWRVTITRNNLLEWKSAAHSSASLSGRSIRRASWSLMWPSAALALVVGGHLSLYHLDALYAAAPILVLWMIAPEIAIWSAKPRVLRREELGDKHHAFLIGIARRTWHFFETFAGPDDNWLPPDNFQEYPKGEIAHRTSPTNIGMFLVSALTARDFGFITTSDFLVRSRNTLQTLERMKSYRGHFLNWYDTRNLDPLEPQYVSTVDSGNLAVSLIALKQGFIEIANGAAFDAKCFEGLDATLDLLLSAARDLEALDAPALGQCEELIRRRIHDAVAAPLTWQSAIDDLSGTSWSELEKIVRDAIARSEDVSPDVLNEIHVWMDRFHHHLHAMQRDIGYYLPWQSLFTAAPPSLSGFTGEIGGLLSPLVPIPQIRERGSRILEEVDARLAAGGLEAGASEWLGEFRRAVQDGIGRQRDLQQGLNDMAERADGYANGMDFTFLYDPEVRLFVIGYNLSLGQLDGNHYDLLATEARIASFFALAKNDAPVEHWYSFSRPMTRLQGKPSILSWNGSMFEYLMAPLFLPSRRDTLLGESELTAVDYQRRYAEKRGVPWGISESAFGITDADGNYQYRAFGVPGLGIRRGLTRDLVVAPYATALALCAWPNTAVENLRALEKLGAVTCYGFMDALDFTPGRVSEARAFVPVQTYMAHHQGMTIAAIANVLNDDILVNRVLREKSLLALDHLLQERVPWDVPLEAGRADEAWERHADTHVSAAPGPWVPSPQTPVAQAHLIGNGRMSVLVSDSGSGRLTWRGNALTRWRPDPTRDCHGIWLYVQDAESRDPWSATRLPTGSGGQNSRTVFHQHMVESFRRDNEITIRSELTVAPFDDVEIRRFTFMNEGDRARVLDLTSYGEVVLAPPQEDERHPAFSKLFVGSSFLARHNALLFERRARRPEVVPPVLLHKLVAQNSDVELRACETDRARFLGRNGKLKSPRGLVEGLSNTTGWTLDPVMSLQMRLRLKPMQTKQITLLTVAGTSRGQVLQTAERFSEQSLERAFRDASLETARAVRHLGIGPEHLPELQMLSSLLLQPDASLRSVGPAGTDRWQGQPDLWRFGISGDLPILLVKIEATQDSGLLDILTRGQRLWHRAGLAMDLVVLRDGISSYEEPLREHILSILRDSHSEGFLGRSGGIHLLSSDQIDTTTRKGLEAAAHVVLTDDHRTLAEKLDDVLETRTPPPRFEPVTQAPPRRAQKLARPQGLVFENGYGGFDPVAKDYVMHLEPGVHTPSPWCNVLANDGFGTIVNESGLGFTWAVNSGEHRLTPWSNDPVVNEPGEVLFLRDEATAEVWSPTPAPAGQTADCRIRHASGHTVWTQHSHELEQELLAFVPVDAPVKLVRLRLKNISDHERRITATYYAEWLLGAMGSVSKPHVVTLYDPGRKAIIAKNHWNPEFSARTAFLTASLDPHSVTGNRRDFLGKEGDIAAPDAMLRWDLGGRFTPGADACAAYQVHLEVAPGETTEVVFVLGEAGTDDTAAALIKRWKDPQELDVALDDLKAFWKTRLGAVQVKTPDPAFDLMVNQWLPYQNMSCRIMARAGFYQAGGAYGFRDQLQDMLGVLFSDPQRARDHILLAAGHQFEAGDVLHWWHPPESRGVKTKCSDDYLWLPYVTARYIAATGDGSILDEMIPFLTAPDLRAGEHDRYARFDSGAAVSLFEHCARAMDRMMETGSHGLPLMGTGDWNDGMDRVGDDGKGESVWLAWFQIATVRLFAPIAIGAGQKDHAQRWQNHVANLRAALKTHAWDGAWYIRAFDDAGLPWGSQSNDECQIDLIAQSWSVLSGDPIDDRALAAMDSAFEKLVSPQERLVRLLAPPFYETSRDPGYIQAYPPGIRENGGQYTHAAAWMGLALSALGDGDRAWQVFDIINPIRRTSAKEGADHYRREPYVLTGDVSGLEGQSGQGGWSWYTGAAGWSWQLAVEGILGVQVRKGEVHLDPCLPKSWGGAEVSLRGANGTVSVVIRDPANAGKGIAAMTVDGKSTKKRSVRFPGSQKTRKVEVILGTGSERR